MVAQEEQECTAVLCSRPQAGLGLCTAHRYRRKKGLPMDEPIKVYKSSGRTVCSVETCVRWGSRFGYCRLHYDRIRAGSDLTAPIRERLRRPGGWGTRPNGYVSRTIWRDDRKTYELQHRFVIEQSLGRPLKHHENVHHLNGVRSDNRLENLELWTKSQPPGQRVKDKVQWAIELLRLYRPDALAKGDGDVPNI